MGSAFKSEDARFTVLDECVKQLRRVTLVLESDERINEVLEMPQDGVFRRAMIGSLEFSAEITELAIQELREQLGPKEGS